jgi:hypothetical protein
MATTNIPKDFSSYTINPRPSTETDHRHLLADSVAASSAASTVGGDITPRAYSPSTTPRVHSIAEPQPYRGFPSEAAYLDALRAWAEEKKYLRCDTELKGWFGTTTTEEYASRPKVELGLNLGLREKWRARKGRRREAKG